MMEVQKFNRELAALYQCKPPISKAKMNAITKGAIKGIKYYKHIVQSVEKFIQKCKTEYKIPGLYVIDSIVRQSRHQNGSDNDVFAPRFAKNILITFYYLFKCPPEDKSKVIRVLNLWQKSGVFDEEVIQPIFDLADPHHELHKEIAMQINQRALKHQAQQAQQQAAPHTPQQSHTPQNTSTSQTIASQAAAPMPSASLAMSVPSGSMQLTTSSQASSSSGMVTSLDPNLIQQIQQILMKTDEGPTASAVAALSGIHPQATLLSQPGALGASTHGQLLTSQPPPTFSQAQLHPVHQMPMSVAAPMAIPDLAPRVSTVADYDSRSLPFLPMDMSQPPPGYLQTFGALSTAGAPQMMAAGVMQSVAPHGMTAPVADFPPVITIPADSKGSPREEGEHSGDGDDNKENGQSDDQVIEIRDRSRSASYSRTRRSRRRSRSRTRSRSRHRRSRSRGRRSRSRERRDRDRRGRDRERTDPDKEAEREKERERKKRGLPPMKHDHLSVCSTTLWVGHLSKLVHQEELSDTFGEFGDIVSIDLIPPRGCAFICMNRRQDATRALTKLKNFKMLNKTITLAWAPGKGVRGKEFKDCWEVDVGCSYVPHKKLSTMSNVDLDSLEEGGVIDEDTVPQWLKGKLTATRQEEETPAMSTMTHLPPPNMIAMNVPPPTDPNMNKVQLMPAFPLANIPPPGVPHGGIPMLPPLGVPPPLGMPPMNVAPVSSMMGHNLLAGVPPHVTIANTNLVGSLGPMQVANVSDQDSMDVEMEDVEKPEPQPSPVKAKPSMTEILMEAEGRTTEDKKENNGEQLQNRAGVPMQTPPFGPPVGIRFGLMPRSGPGFGPRPMSTLPGFQPRNFLGPPPVIGARPGLVPDIPNPGMLPRGIGFRPIAPANLSVPPPLPSHFPNFNKASSPPPTAPSMTEAVESETAKNDWDSTSTADKTATNGGDSLFNRKDNDTSSDSDRRNPRPNHDKPREFGGRENRFRGNDRGRPSDRGFDNRRSHDRGYGGHDRESSRSSDGRRDFRRRDSDRGGDREWNRGSFDRNRDFNRGGDRHRDQAPRQSRFRDDDRHEGGRSRWCDTNKSRWENDRPNRWGPNNPNEVELGKRPEKRPPISPEKPSETSLDWSNWDSFCTTTEDSKSVSEKPTEEPTQTDTAQFKSSSPEAPSNTVQKERTPVPETSIEPMLDLPVQARSPEDRSPVQTDIPVEPENVSTAEEAEVSAFLDNGALQEERQEVVEPICVKQYIAPLGDEDNLKSDGSPKGACKDTPVECLSNASPENEES